MFDPTPQGAVLTDACRRDLYVFNRVLSKPNVFRLIAGSTLPEAVGAGSCIGVGRLPRLQISGTDD